MDGDDRDSDYKLYSKLTPFHKVLGEVIRGYEDGTDPNTPPTPECLKFLLGFLSHQEDKAYAINEGLVEAVAAIFQNVKNNRDFDDNRVVLVQILESCVMFQAARRWLLQDLGMEAVLMVLNDESPAVRAASARMVALLLSFLDVRDMAFTREGGSEDYPGKYLLESITYIFLEDEFDDIAVAAVPSLMHLCQMNPVPLNENVTGKLVALLRKFANATVSTQDFLRHYLYNIIQTLVNICIHRAMKESVLQEKIVNAITPFLEDRDYNVKKASASLLMILSTSEAHKVAIVENPQCLTLLAAVVLSQRTPIELRANASSCLKNVALNTRGMLVIGGKLQKAPEILLEIMGYVSTANVAGQLYAIKESRLDALHIFELLLRYKKGSEAVWNILDIVPSLYYVSSGQAAQEERDARELVTEATDELVRKQQAVRDNALNSERVVAERCLAELTMDSKDAQSIYERVQKEKSVRDEQARVVREDLAKYNKLKADVSKRAAEERRRDLEGGLAGGSK